MSSWFGAFDVHPEHGEGQRRNADDQGEERQDPLEAQTGLGLGGLGQGGGVGSVERTAVPQQRQVPIRRTPITTDWPLDLGFDPASVEVDVTEVVHPFGRVGVCPVEIALALPLPKPTNECGRLETTEQPQQPTARKVHRDLG